MKSNQELEEIFQAMMKARGGDEAGNKELSRYYNNPLAKILFILHHHELESEKIVYREEDVIELLGHLGYSVTFE